ncbi:hypothetical protein BO83DRAFT_39500 [Aspergillus eucalypticola CBS 122712]|uniref:Uncharacterized protein n=1 Tax=Aspergillus eucalypticola (strain CBS 122712 / IBT 29274) TaxID=1448314 RepID=A0A317VFQ6_ASPEC|nr:uncharacterized protein BO83DRAFT_39500 [Aspergillus eucalypticola CBS 122712]PWY72755.1 hypothetical protein BO83DRAFT_39500 [Aspergillus eucalypticola CBS 122712]
MRDDRQSICTVATKISGELYEKVYETRLEVCKTPFQGAVLHYTVQLKWVRLVFRPVKIAEGISWAFEVSHGLVGFHL